MSTLKRIKNTERLVVDWLKTGAGRFWRLFAGIRHRSTSSVGGGLHLIIAPRSGQRSWSLTLSTPLLVLVVAIVMGASGYAAFVSIRHIEMNARLASLGRELSDAEDELERMRLAAERLTVSARRFEETLARTMQQTGDRDSLPSVPNLGGLPLSWSPGAAEQRDIAVMEKLAMTLDASALPVARIGSLMENQGRVMNEIPNIWPIRGAVGHISMYFGQNEHPFSGQWYIHNGIDISTFRTGDSVLAAADGKVVQTGYDSGLGNFITLQHAHGFFTRYGHLQALRASRGQKVHQGQVIGLVGNTGRSTGPHLHYEVHLGTSVIDPLKFLNLRKTMQPEAARTGSSASGAPSTGKTGAGS